MHDNHGLGLHLRERPHSASWAVRLPLCSPSLFGVSRVTRCKHRGLRHNTPFVSFFAPSATVSLEVRGSYVPGFTSPSTIRPRPFSDPRRFTPSNDLPTLFHVSATHGIQRARRRASAPYPSRPSRRKLARAAVEQPHYRSSEKSLVTHHIYVSFVSECFYDTTSHSPSSPTSEHNGRRATRYCMLRQFGHERHR